MFLIEMLNGLNKRPLISEVVTEKCSVKDVFCSVNNFFKAILRDTDYNFHNYVLKDKLDSTLIHLKKAIGAVWCIFFFNKVTWKWQQRSYHILNEHSDRSREKKFYLLKIYQRLFSQIKIKKTKSSYKSALKISSSLLSLSSVETKHSPA